MAEQSSQAPGKQREAASGLVIFRPPVTALVPVVVLVVCATPFAFGAPGLQAVYVIPLAIAYWVLRTRTTADAARLVVRTVFGSRELSWTGIESLRVPERGWVRALVSGKEIPLAGVRARHLPVLAAVSGGYLADPSEQLASTEADATTTGAAGERDTPQTPESGQATENAAQRKEPSAAD